MNRNSLFTLCQHDSGDCGMTRRWMLPYINKRCPTLLKNRVRRHLLNCEDCRNIFRELLHGNYQTLSLPGLT